MEDKPNVHHVTIHHTGHEHTKKRDIKFLVIAIMLGVLIITAGVQAFELVSLNNKITSGGVSAPSAAASSSVASNNVPSAPTMVGGC